MISAAPPRSSTPPVTLDATITVCRIGNVMAPVPSALTPAEPSAFISTTVHSPGSTVQVTVC